MQRMNTLMHDKRLCSTLNRIRVQAQREYSDEALYVQWLEKSLVDMRKMNDQLQGVPLNWNQGACQVLQELINSFQIAHDIVRKE